jgi:uncharacterized protein YdiU (UPF0061 family)
MQERSWNFDNSYTRLSSHFYSPVETEPTKEAKLILFNHHLAEKLNLPNEEQINPAYLSANAFPPGSSPIAQAYAGHQFGHFNMLGDGRALLIGEQITPHGNRFDIQLKGSGPTPYSRRGDGRATLSAMLREYLYSEAMYGLGISTTRSLAVVKTGEQVIREDIHEGAVLARIAKSHLRVGTFEYAAHIRGEAALKELLDYTIDRHYPHLKEESNPALGLLNEVMNHQIALIVDWMRVGFIHGVMNTDNMSIAGETIDYGPCAFMNRYDPNTVFSSIDTAGRYAFGNQPAIAQWNLGCLASALLSAIDPIKEKAIEIAKEKLAMFPKRFDDRWCQMMARKIGFSQSDEATNRLIHSLLDIMKTEQGDYTNVFSHLMDVPVPDDTIYHSEIFIKWKEKHKQLMNERSLLKTDLIEIMRKENPIYIPKNYLVEDALERFVQQQDDTLFHALITLMKNPYTFKEENRNFQLPPSCGDADYKTFCNT